MLGTSKFQTRLCFTNELSRNKVLSKLGKEISEQNVEYEGVFDVGTPCSQADRNRRLKVGLIVLGAFQEE
jgi:hypothetical protein